MYHFYLGGKRIMRKTEDIKLLIFWWENYYYEAGV